MAATQDAILSEEMHASTNLVRKETIQACGSSDDQHTINIKEEEDGKINQPPQSPKISKVPKKLRGRKDFRKHFQPRKISVGPYHHGKKNLEQIQELKPRWEELFIKGSSQKNKALHGKILSEISQLKEYYKAPYGFYDDDALAGMMLQDGCSVLFFIFNAMHGKFRELNIGHRRVEIIMQDLFLLENQLPFPVLELLLESRKTKDVSMQTIEELISWIAGVEPRPAVRPVTKEEKPSHLLDLLRTRLLGKPASTNKRGNNDSYFCRNVKKLMANGIRFRPSKTSELRDVSFNSYGVTGYLNLPPLAIDRFTVPVLWNLIAYERCPSITPGSGVTSFLSFLDLLIDYPEDVDLLESAQVLQISFASSEAVAHFFNSISVNLTVEDFGFYSQVLADIRSHQSKKTYIWTSQLLDTYCSSPWKVIALFATIVVIFLTGTQTYFTVFPH